LILAELKHYTLVTGSGEGSTTLNAFDQALLNSGVGNTNLVKLSSILPPNLSERQRADLALAPGSLLPIAFGHICSEVEGQTISAGVGIGIIPGSYGVIVEASGAMPGKALELRLQRMVGEALANRRVTGAEVRVDVSEHRVRQRGCAFAGVALWG